MNALLVRVEALLQGEWARAIMWGAIAAVWIATHAAFALGVVATPPPSFDTVLIAVSTALVIVNELIRKGVYSSSSVDALLGIAEEWMLAQAGPPPPAPDPEEATTPTPIDQPVVDAPDA